MNKLPVSVIILTYNEEKNIEDCIKSIYNWVDEIFIVDSYSTDNTIEIAKKYTEKIYQHPFQNFSQQRNWAQSNLPIKNEWVFHLDADERVSPGLATELKKIFYSDVNADGFMVPRRTVFRGRCIKYGGHYPVYHLRIFKKNKGHCEERLYDQHYIVKGEILKIEKDLINLITPDLKLWKMRHRRWAYLEAMEIIANKDRLANLRLKDNPIEKRKWLRYNVYYKIPLFIRPFIYFFYRYILKLGFLDGRQGLIFHFWQGFWYRFLVDLNIYKLRKYDNLRDKCLSS
jgi:glycosyltransferase involved in cell wall biosynthesis